MADGRYRVTQGEDGARYLYLFPPGGGKHYSIVLDTGEDDALEVVVGWNGLAAEWSVDAFERLLDDLAQDQTSEIRSVAKEEP